MQKNKNNKVRIKKEKKLLTIWCKIKGAIQHIHTNSNGIGYHIQVTFVEALHQKSNLTFREIAVQHIGDLVDFWK